MSEPYVTARVFVKDLRSALFAGWRAFAFLDLGARAGKGGAVRSSSRELARAWDVDDAAVERWLRALAKAGYLEVRRVGVSARAGRTLVLLDPMHADRGNPRGKSEAKTEAIPAIDSNDLQKPARQSARQRRGNPRGTYKDVIELEELNPLPTEEGATGSRNLVLVGSDVPEVVPDDGLSEEQRDLARDLLKSWIAMYTQRAGFRPERPTIAKQGAIAKQLVAKYTEEGLRRAFAGMDAHWKHKGNKPWTLLNMAGDMDEVVGLAMLNPAVKEQVAYAAFEEALRAQGY